MKDVINKFEHAVIWIACVVAFAAFILLALATAHEIAGGCSWFRDGAAGTNEAHQGYAHRHGNRK